MVICQTDIAAIEASGGVSTKPPPRIPMASPSPSTSTTIDYSINSSKSCMVLPQFGKKTRKKKKNLVPSSSAASTADQSSQADAFLSTPNDTRSLLQSSRNNKPSAGDWYVGTPSETSETMDDFPKAQPVTPSSQDASLLSFPEARDRSHQSRRTQQWAAYDGEMEPQGVRGQEAKLVPLDTSSNSSIPLRSFTGGGGGDQSSVASSQDNNIQTMNQQDFVQRNHQHQHQHQKGHPPLFHSTTPALSPSHSQNKRRTNNRHNDSMSSESSQTTTQFEIFENNAAEIAQQDVPTSKSPRQQQQQQHHKQQQQPEGRNVPPTFRKSAPVNVDDSSFEDPVENVQGIHAMGMEHVLRGEYDLALQAFSQVLQVYLDQYGRAHPLTASAYHNLGTVHSKRAGLLLDHTLHQRHCREQALLCFQAASRAARDAPQLGPRHPNVAVSLVRIGFLLLQSRQYQNAVITFQEALRIRTEHYGATHALVANLYNNLGVCHLHLQEFPLGRKYLQQALDNQKELLAQDEFSTTALLELADTLCNIGGLCLEWIRRQGPDARHALDAELAFLEALEVRTKVLGDNHALTNQVRSLHDMVRSIPLPKMSPGSRSRSPSRNRRPPSPGRSPISIKSSPRSPHSTSSNSPGRSSPGRPYATAERTPSPRRISPSTPARAPKNIEALNMPSLMLESAATIATRPRDDDEDGSPKRLVLTTSIGNSPTNTTQKSIGPMDRSAQSELTSTFSSMDERMHDVTEESCVLSGFLEDNGQVSTVVSYAQTTANFSASSQKDSDRSACLSQAKAILDLHKDVLDSPQLALDKKRKPPTAIASMEQPLANGDGLALLGGTWPESSKDFRITPQVLDHPEQHLPTIQQCAVNYMKRGRFGEALHLLEMVLECQRAKNGPLHEDVGAALHNVGIVYLRMEHHYKAIQAFEEAVRVRKGALGRDHPQVAVSLVKVGIALLLLKRYEDSLWIFREALTVRKQALGNLHPSTARIYNNIGCVHVEFKELKEARRAFEAALDIQRNALVHDPESGPILFGAATTLQNLGYLYRKRDMQEKASVVLREALSLKEKVLGPHHPTVMSTLDSLADTCAAANHGTLGLKYYNEILERFCDQEDESKLQEAVILYKMSKIHKQANDLEPQLNKLIFASKVLRMEDSLTNEGKQLEHQIEMDIRLAQQELEEEELREEELLKEELEWV